MREHEGPCAPQTACRPSRRYPPRLVACAPAAAALPAGTVCDDDFTDAAAGVVCQQLGLGSSGTAVGRAAFGPGSGPIWLDGVRCTGAEVRLQGCPHGPWNASDCSHEEDVGVRCYGETGERELLPQVGKVAACRGASLAAQRWRLRGAPRAQLAAPCPPAPPQLHSSHNISRHSLGHPLPGLAWGIAQSSLPPRPMPPQPPCGWSVAPTPMPPRAGWRCSTRGCGVRPAACICGSITEPCMHTLVQVSWEHS